MTWIYRKVRDGEWAVAADMSPADGVPMRPVHYATVMTEKDARYMVKLLSEHGPLRETATRLVGHLRYGQNPEYNQAETWQAIDEECERITHILGGQENGWPDGIADRRTEVRPGGLRGLVLHGRDLRRAG